LSKGAVPVDPAAYMKSVTRHALGEKKKDNQEDDYKQETSKSKTRWLRSCNAGHASGSLPRACATKHLLARRKRFGEIKREDLNWFSWALKVRRKTNRHSRASPSPPLLPGLTPI
jgi:hypothetical protein